METENQSQWVHNESHFSLGFCLLPRIIELHPLLTKHINHHSIPWLQWVLNPILNFQFFLKVKRQKEKIFSLKKKFFHCQCPRLGPQNLLKSFSWSWSNAVAKKMSRTTMEEKTLLTYKDSCLAKNNNELLRKPRSSVSIWWFF